MMNRFKFLILITALPVCLTLAFGPLSCGADWSMVGTMARSIGGTAMSPVKNLVGVSRSRESEDDDDNKGDDKEPFEAMCLIAREPNLKGPPEMIFFSRESHSSSTLGCTKGQATFKLESSPSEENEDSSLRRQIIQTNLYNGSLSTYFIIHGFMASWDSSWMCHLKDLILNGSEANVFIVDWSGGSKPLLPIDYGAAVANTKLVAELVADFIRDLVRISSVEDASRFHLIGHSLGGQISGFVGYSLDGNLGRITALDPAGPCFRQWNPMAPQPSKDASVEGFLEESSNRRRLSASSAKLVIAIHTDCALFGLNENCAHYDIYVNGGSQQPDCAIQSGVQLMKEILQANLANKMIADVTCSHSYGHDLYETFDYYSGDRDASYNGTRCYPMAYECSSWESFNAGECGFCLDNDARCIFIGFNQNVGQNFPATRLRYSNQTQTSTRLFNDQGSDDCRFNRESNCDALSLLNYARHAISSSPSSSSSASSSTLSSTYLISTAKHFIKSGPSKSHCVYHYQVLIAVKKEEGEVQPGSKYYLRIPLQQGDSRGNNSSDVEPQSRERLVQVSNIINRKSPAYADIHKSYLRTMRTAYKPIKKLAKGPMDYISALITFRLDCKTETQGVQSLCRPLESLDGAQLWSTEGTPLEGVQWVAINFMSSLMYETRIKNSHILQVISDKVQTGSGPLTQRDFAFDDFRTPMDYLRRPLGHYVELESFIKR